MTGAPGSGAASNGPAPRTSAWVVPFALGAALLGWCWWQTWFLCDDAFIAFRYVGNAHDGHGLVWNPAPFAPVEGYSIFMMFDEETLKAIADITGAEYFHATTADELHKVYETLGSKLVLQKERTEISSLFAAVAALLIGLAAALSLAWFSRIV